MATRTAESTLRVVFGKAFLLELRRGNLDRARVFARAFLVVRSLHASAAGP